MKIYKIKYLGVLLLGLFTCFSCDDFLEEEPEHILTTSNFYNTEADAIAAIDAVYASIQSGNRGWGDFMLSYGDATTDDTFTDPAVGSAQWQGFSRLNINSSISYLNTLWDDHYRTIFRANLVIERVSEDIAIRDRVVGEARFFRALAYFNLVRFFGDVPFVLEGINDDNLAFEIASTRTSSVTIYEQIEADLLAAAADLPNTYSGGEAGRATAGSAMGLLSKVYLTWAGAPINDISKFQLAADMAENVVNNRGDFGYALEPVYLDAFQNKLGPESLFEIQGIFGLGVLSGGSLLGITVFPRNQGGILGANYRGNALARPTPDLINAFDPADLRLQTGMLTSIANAEGVESSFDPHYNKYIEQDLLLAGFVLNDGDINQKILRFADVLLIYAEALNEVGGPTQAAYDAINEVRERAGIDPLGGLDQDSFREAVYEERRLELFTEGQRWFDLVRWGRYVSTMEAFRDAQLTLQDYPNPATTSTFLIEKNIQSHFTLMPLPQTELDILVDAPDIQNPGY